MFPGSSNLQALPVVEGWIPVTSTGMTAEYAARFHHTRKRSKAETLTTMRTRDWLLLIFLSLLWGLAFFFIAVAIRGGVPIFTIVLTRVGIAALALLPVLLALGHSLPRNTATWRLFIVQALLNNVFPFSLIVYGQTHVTSGIAAVINATTPLFSLLVARAVVGEALSTNKVLGVLFGIAGVAILIGAELAHAHVGSLIGMASLLAAALFYGLSAFWMRRLRTIPPIVSAACQLTCSTLMLLPIAAVVDRFWLLPVPGVETIGALVGLAILGTALAYIVFFRISASAGPNNVMLVTLLIPVSAAGLGILFLGEHLTLHQVAGALVIAFGLIVTDGRLLPYLRRRLVTRS